LSRKCGSFDVSQAYGLPLLVTGIVSPSYRPYVNIMKGAGDFEGEVCEGEFICGDHIA
jgi:hypothetical protein